MAYAKFEEPKGKPRTLEKIEKRKPKIKWEAWGVEERATCECGHTEERNLEKNPQHRQRWSAM
ncbi:UDP-glucose 4-epimerase GalE [Sesbania bispinosa]|nr:UDP-glucose 4-epimerase GalE [Sesbania bispinosa]